MSTRTLFGAKFQGKHWHGDFLTIEDLKQPGALTGPLRLVWVSSHPFDPISVAFIEGDCAYTFHVRVTMVATFLAEMSPEDQATLHELAAK
ncbi:MAG: hypothetical protein R3E83_19045 [Burkholderiaceae bacterium]